MFMSILLAIMFAGVVSCSENKTFADERDGKEYRYAKIGSQIWMAENLNYDSPGSLCYDNDPAMCKNNGSLYNWEMAKKACPKGWHLPCEAEWRTLADFASEKGAEHYGFVTTPGGWWGSSIHPMEFEYSLYVNNNFDIAFTSPPEFYSVRCIKGDSIPKNEYSDYLIEQVNKINMEQLSD